MASIGYNARIKNTIIISFVKWPKGARHMHLLFLECASVNSLKFFRLCISSLMHGLKIVIAPFAEQQHW